MTPTEMVRTDPTTSPFGPFARFWLGLKQGLARLFRPVRAGASPTWRLFPSSAETIAALLIAAGLTLAGMVYLDPPIHRAQMVVAGFAAQLFEIVTEAGKSHWYLVPTGVAVIGILALPAARTFSDRVLRAIALRYAFVFLAVGGSGLIITVVKRIIGRGRPVFFDDFGALHFDFNAWAVQYASFPSGHSQTAFAFAVALACLFPRWRAVLIAAATLVAVSRVIVEAHYFTDIVVGAAWGAWFALMTREWFARRGLLFAPGPGRRPFAMPRRRYVAGFGQFLRRFTGR